MKTHKIMALFTAMVLFQTLGAQSNEDHYVGTFSNQQSGLVLSMGKASDGTYQGFLDSCLGTTRTTRVLRHTPK